MTFNEMLKYLFRGHAMRRPTWNSNSCIVFDAETEGIYHITKSITRLWKPLNPKRTAKFTDWEIL